MAMSGADSKASEPEPVIIQFHREDETPAVGGKPCIDFQPGDRWQIKDDDDKSSDKIKRNSKIKDIKTSSNGSTTRRLRSCKSNKSVVNGEAIDLSSDEEDTLKVETKSNDRKAKGKSHVNSESLCNNKRTLKRKRPILKRETKAMPDTGTVQEKKKKVSEVETNDIQICDDNSDNGSEKCKDDDSNDKRVMPNLSPAATEYDDDATKKTVVSKSMEVIDVDTEKPLTSKDNLSKGNVKNVQGRKCPDLESLPKLDEFSHTDLEETENNQMGNSTKVENSGNSNEDAKKNKLENTENSNEETNENIKVDNSKNSNKEANENIEVENSSHSSEEIKNSGENLNKEVKNNNEEIKNTSENSNEEIKKNKDENSEISNEEAKKETTKYSEKSHEETKEEITEDTVKSCDETKKNSEVEIINILDESKKSSENSEDGESDSEIQILNSDVRPKTRRSEFPSSKNATEDITLSAGYPYFNSLKEKMSGLKAGEYMPVKFPHTGTLMLHENEVIIESPSLLVPLLIKSSDEFPSLESDENTPNSEESPTVKPIMISKRNFFQSSVGQFLINLGMSRVQEWYQGDMKRVKQKQLRKSPGDHSLQEDVQAHSKRQAELKEINAIFNFRLRRCQFCNFKSESRAVLEGHYLTPHLSTRREYKCNFCAYMSRDPKEIMFHFDAMHGKKAVLEFNVPFHECIFCSFQSHLKTKVNAHMNRCRKHFIPSQNLSPPFDFEFPGVTTKPVTIADVIAHRRLLLSSAKNQRLPLPEDNSPHGAYARKKLASVLSKLSGQSTYPDMKNPSLMKQLMASQSQQLTALSAAGIQLPPGIVITRPRIQAQQMRQVGRFPQPRAIAGLRCPPRRGTLYASSITTAATQLASSGISITPVARPGGIISRTNSAQAMKNVTLTPISAATNRNVLQKPGPPQPVALFTNVAGGSSMMGQPQARIPLNVSVRAPRPSAPYQRLNTPPSQVVKGSSGNTFVMCEICDSYIKDLEELRSHMNWVHKVKIHPKMLVSRPPLNCQKCQWRFFTDQGLERHLLGAHGLVTTNMQEMANKNQDGGRCIICGAVFTYKLVSHMTQVHKVTLKPAHLSYKCTVCTATFTLYRLFESHVYNVHSGSAKRPADDAPSEPPAKKPIRQERVETGPRKCRDCGLVTVNMQDHLIKKHIKQCTVKLCRIEKCEKCLYSSDEMLVIRLSDLGLVKDSDDSSDESDSDEVDTSSEDDSKSAENSSKKAADEQKEEPMESKELQPKPEV